jgi:hypothetical protein
LLPAGRSRLRDSLRGCSACCATTRSAVADFPDVEAYRRYAQDPAHLAIIAEHITPFLAARSSVQYEV